MNLGASRVVRTSGAGRFSPTQLGSKLVAWWNADDHGTANMTDDGAGLISSWSDRIGAMALTAVTTARPTWTAGAFIDPASGIHAGLTGDGAANAMVSTTLTTLPTGATAGEVWGVVTATANAGFALQYGTSPGTTTRTLRYAASGNFSVFDGTTNTQNTATGMVGSQINAGQWSGTTQSGWGNGTPFAANPATIATLNTGTTRCRMFSRCDTAAGSFFNGVIRHILVISGTLSNNQRQQLEGWLAWDSGLRSLLPDGQPYKNRRP